MTATTEPLGTLGPDELVRYSRHVILPEVGLAGQERLKSARILVVGCGGLGSPVALYLAAAGVGHLGLVDFDTVDASNLQRQIIHSTSTVGASKLDSAEARLLNLNPYTRIERYETRLAAANALEIIRGYDVVVDGTDNFSTRYLVNDACVLLGVPNAYGSIFRFEGQASVFAVADGPCYRCLFRRPPPAGAVPNCAEGGVLGVLPGLVGTIQATEAIKLVLGIGKPLVGELLLVDALDMRFRKVKVRKDPQCPACGTREIRELVDEEAVCEVSVERPGYREQTAATIADRRRRGEELLLVDVREPHEWAIGRIEGAELIPLGEIPRSLDRLPREREIVLYCKGGSRSAQAADQLVRAGFGSVTNLAGGILAWRAEVDPSLPRY